MGLVEYLVLVVVVVVLCGATVWVIGQLAPSHPALVDRLIWVLAVVILVVVLANAVGLFGHDVMIPRMR